MQIQIIDNLDFSRYTVLLYITVVLDMVYVRVIKFELEFLLILFCF